MPVNYPNLWKITYNEEKHEVPKLVGRLSVGTITGDLLAAAIFDKKKI